MRALLPPLVLTRSAAAAAAAAAAHYAETLIRIVSLEHHTLFRSLPALDQRTSSPSVDAVAAAAAVVAVVVAAAAAAVAIEIPNGGPGPVARLQSRRLFRRGWRSFAMRRLRLPHIAFYEARSTGSVPSESDKKWHLRRARESRGTGIAKQTHTQKSSVDGPLSLSHFVSHPHIRIIFCNSPSVCLCLSVRPSVCLSVCLSLSLSLSLSHTHTHTPTQIFSSTKQAEAAAEKAE